MFDFGFSEMMLIAVLGLLVLGPERLPRAAKTCGLWIRRARASWYTVKSQFERELADEELRRSLQQARSEIDGLRKDLQQPFEQTLLSPGSARPTAPAADATALPPGDAVSAALPSQDGAGARESHSSAPATTSVGEEVTHDTPPADSRPSRPPT